MREGHRIHRLWSIGLLPIHTEASNGRSCHVNVYINHIVSLFSLYAQLLGPSNLLKTKQNKTQRPPLAVLSFFHPVYLLPFPTKLQFNFLQPIFTPMITTKPVFSKVALTYFLPVPRSFCHFCFMTLLFQ